MFQIIELSAVVPGKWEKGKCRTGWLEIRPDQSGLFERFEVLAATMRYLILRGLTRQEAPYVRFDLPDEGLCLPGFYLGQLQMTAQDP